MSWSVRSPTNTRLWAARRAAKICAVLNGVPGITPLTCEPFAAMLRLMGVVTRTWLLAGAALAVASCTTGSSPRDEHYAVSWRAYNRSASDAAVSRCVALPGARWGMAQPAVLPPVPNLVFSGTGAQRKALQACLLALPDAVIYGPGHGQTRAPVLRR